MPGTWRTTDQNSFHPQFQNNPNYLFITTSEPSTIYQNKTFCNILRKEELLQLCPETICKCQNKSQSINVSLRSVVSGDNLVRRLRDGHLVL